MPEEVVKNDEIKNLKKPAKGFFGQSRNYHEKEFEYLITKSGKKIDNSDPYYYILLQVHHFKNYLNFYFIFNLLISISLIVGSLLIVFLLKYWWAISLFLLGCIFLVNSLRYMYAKYRFVRLLRLYSRKAPVFKLGKTPLPKFMSDIYTNLHHRMLTVNIVCPIVYTATIIIAILHLTLQNQVNNIFIRSNVVYIFDILLFVFAVFFHIINVFIIFKRKHDIEIVFNKGLQLPIWNIKRHLKSQIHKKTKQQNLKLDVETKEHPIYKDNSDW